MRLAAIWLLMTAMPACAADQWIRLVTPHFELYTDVGEGSARDAILRFEQIRSFFNQAAPVRGGVTEFPVRIIVFKNEKQYRPYAINGFAAAYYQGTQWRDYIVMQDAENEHMPTALHEYMHLIVRHSGLMLPVWLNEGWADVYSTLKPLGKKAAVGELIPGRVQELLGGKWLDFDTLTSVGHNSPAYNEANRAGMFYAESWALVHMLYLAPDYKQKFPAFVDAILAGKTAAEACQIAYGRSSAQVFSDLRNYLTRNQLYGVLFPVKLTKAEEEAQVSPASDFDSGLALADLLAAINKRDQAQAAFDRLSRLKPGDPEIPQSLGYLAWQNRDREGARQYFEKAFAAGSDDPQMCYHLATLEQGANQPDGKIMEPLLRALKTRPDYIDARIELGLVELNARNYDAALASFIQLHDIPAERAPTVFNGMAYAYSQKGDLAAARRQAMNARKWDRTDADTRRTDDLIRYLDAREFPGNASKLARVEGIAKSLDCSGAHPRLQVLAGDKVLSFDLADPEQIVLRHNGAAAFDFACGPQKPFPVVVEYIPAGNPDQGSAGAVRALEF